MKNRSELIHLIVKNVSQPSLLEQCAEECTELAHACLKASRKLRDENPTPVSFLDISDNIVEESADVRLCIDILAESFNREVNGKSSEYIYDAKLNRWIDRLEGV